MAICWYLLKDEWSQLSDYAADEFAATLDSSAAIDVELYNYDLSECQQIRAVIQNRVQDTKLNSVARQALVPIGTFKAGMYIKYDNRFWLIVGLVDNNGVYEKGVLALCNFYLAWINDDGEIVRRWANVTSASQYNNGESYFDNFYARSNQLMVIIPDDDDSLLLDSGKRFIIDKRTSVYEKNFDSDVTVSTDNPLMTYKLTRADSVLYDYQGSGHTEFLATQCEQEDGDGYYVIDGTGYWLCEQPTDTEDAGSPLQSAILCDEPIIYNGFDGSVFVARFYDTKGKEVSDVVPIWTIDADFADSLDVAYVDNAVSIAVDNDKLSNRTFTLSLTADGYETVEITVTIKAFI